MDSTSSQCALIRTQSRFNHKSLTHDLGFGIHQPAKYSATFTLQVKNFNDNQLHVRQHACCCAGSQAVYYRIFEFQWQARIHFKVSRDNWRNFPQSFSLQKQSFIQLMKLRLPEECFKPILIKKRTLEENEARVWMPYSLSLALYNSWMSKFHSVPVS